MKPLHKKAQVRKFHKAAKAQGRRMEIAFFLQDWEDAYNVGGMFRVADACGAVEIFSSGRTPDLNSPMIGVTSMGHHRRIPYHHFDKHDDAVDAIKQAGFALVMIEIAEGAVPYSEFDYPEKVCFVLGNEERGIYTNVMKKADAVVFIPQFGKGRSMNVHVAGAVVAFNALLERDTADE
ncbi:MAG: hypothetical protein KF784_09830 [Fimbriimonadaceae bacterium]|nr:hypothetical protein [Fimbriimonadaceae bacterium]